MKIQKAIKELLEIYKEYDRQIDQLRGKINNLKDIRETVYIKLKKCEYGCKIGDIITDSKNIKWKVTGFYLYWLKGHKIKKNGELYKYTNTIYDVKQKYDFGFEDKF